METMVGGPADRIREPLFVFVGRPTSSLHTDVVSACSFRRLGGSSSDSGKGAGPEVGPWGITR